MNFKLSLIVAALAVVGTAAEATPLTPNHPLTDYTSGTTDIFISGSSAVDLALTKFIANTCAPGSLDTYRTDASGKTYYLWTCQAGSGSAWGLGSNTKIAIHKNTNSSTDGVTAVASATPLAFLQVSDLTPAAACPIGPTVVGATATIPTYNTYSCGTTAGNNGVGTLTQAPIFGFADSEPTQFNPSAAAKLTTVYPLTIVFGVPVTQNVRNALQASQGKNVGGEEEADMPTLTSAQVNSIFTQNFTAWSDLGITLPGSDQNIYVVRRSNGSGTTRAFDATFIGDFCTPGLNSIATGPTLVTATIPTQCTTGATSFVTAGTSDDMAACLSSFQSNGAAGAIGYLSTDYTPGTSDTYRWVKVDGVSPKLLNVANGAWKDWSEESLNFKTVTGGLTGDNLKFYNAIKATSTNGGLLSEIAQNLPQTTSGKWTGGVMGALPNKGWGVAPTANSLLAGRTDASVIAFPANLATRNVSGYNLCNVPAPTSGFQAQ